MPYCPRCHAFLSSDELGDLLTGVSDRPPASAPSPASEPESIDFKPLGPADARGPESADNDIVSFGL